ncbi:MAG: hypothetical protein DI548_13555, partial [Flavobacterium johnsoniae]
MFQEILSYQTTQNLKKINKSQTVKLSLAFSFFSKSLPVNLLYDNILKIISHLCFQIITHENSRPK